MQDSDLTQRDEVAVRHLLPLVHQPHALGIHQSVAVYSPGRSK